MLGVGNIHCFEHAKEISIFSQFCSSILWSGEGTQIWQSQEKSAGREEKRNNDPHVNVNL